MIADTGIFQLLFKYEILFAHGRKRDKANVQWYEMRSLAENRTTRKTIEELWIHLSL